MSQAVYIQEGREIDYTPGADVDAGEVVVQENLVGIAKAAIDSGDLGALSVSGIFDIQQKAEIIVAGDAVYWDANGDSVSGTAGEGAATAEASGNTFMGFAQTLTAAADSNVRVALRSAESVAGGVSTATSITGTASTLPIAGLAAAQGGAVSVTGGASATTGLAGGAVTQVGGLAGATGIGGASSVIGGGGGATSGTGGAAAVTGGAARSAASNAVGGAVAVTGGIGKGNLAGGAVSVVGGLAGTTGAGGAVAVTGGAGGLTSGTGGAVAIAAGAGTDGNANGGALTILAGNAEGSGTDGTLGIGTSNTSALTIGATSIATAIPGPLTHGIGASTAAAGSATGDAGALPAATASVYPTTAADDTKGVLIHDDDKVTGRMLMIGNGVVNKILKVYPASGGTINGAGANAAFSSVSGKGVITVCLSSGSNTWLAW